MKFLFLIPLILFSCSTKEVQKMERIQDVGSGHRARYPLADASQKLVDNRGNGYEDLYGTRNVRAVLNGVYYRGGANNAYHRDGRRNNSNPIPDSGLENLCEEGFGSAVYLYSTNFSKAPKKIRCITFEGQENILNYQQISPLSYRRADQEKLIHLIYTHLTSPRLGPIYDHCWNGWHASGYVAAITLRQFCGFSADEAVAYWNKNTDGNNKGSSYDKLRRNIRNFQLFPQYQISDAERKTLCPAPDSLIFR